jgi:hypothetical protein
MDREPSGPSLAEVEATLYDLITAPEGVAKRLTELSQSPADLELIVKPTAGLSAVDRVDIYANMYFYRIRDVLREEFAKVLDILGDDGFHNLVTDYLVACRPKHPSLRDAGARLPAFLAEHPLAEGRAWVAELARLERTHLELHDGPDAEALSLEFVRTIQPAELGALTLLAIPSHRLLRNRFQVSAVWKAPDRHQAAGAPREISETLLVWRQDLTVFHRAVPADEEALLQLVATGARFDIVCERLLESEGDERAIGRAFELLTRWVVDGLICAAQ